LKAPSFIKGAHEAAAGARRESVPPSRLTAVAVAALREAGVKNARAYRCTIDVPIREAGNIADDGTVRVMAIRAGKGNPTDGNVYTESFIESIVPLLAGAPSHLDHPTAFDDQNLPERSVTTLAGWFSDPHIGDFTDPEHPELGTVKGAFATFHPVVGNEVVLGLLRTCREKNALYPDKEPFISYSINAWGAGAPGEIDGEQYNIVSKCTQLESVDMVTHAGAAGRPILTESKAKENMRLRLSPAKFFAKREAAAAAAPNFLRGGSTTSVSEARRSVQKTVGVAPPCFLRPRR